VPGRGGIAISEAMAFGLPVIVHEADGTEYDLVMDRVTGIRVSQGDAGSFCEAIGYIADHPDVCFEMGRNSRRLVETRFTTRNMVQQIIHAAHYAKTARACPRERRCDP
jgi:glycosyltransferase involved in cell wall biosynthesis